MKINTFSVIVLLYYSIKCTDLETHDGETIELDLNGSGKRDIKFSIDGQEIDIPLIEKPTILSEKRGMPDELYKKMAEKAADRAIRREYDYDYLDNVKNIKKNDNFVLRMEHLPITYSLSDPKYDHIEDMPKFDPHLCIDEVKNHVLGIYRIVKNNEKSRDLGQILDDTKFAEAWANKYLKEQRYLLEVNNVSPTHPQLRVLDLTLNTFRNMYKAMRNDYSKNKMNAKSYKRYLKAVNMIVEKLIPIDKTKEVK